jgi:hypothetical protein
VAGAPREVYKGILPLSRVINRRILAAALSSAVNFTRAVFMNLTAQPRQ